MTDIQQGATSAAPFSVNGTALYSPDDDTLRWSNSERLTPVEYAEAKNLGFKLWRGSSAWVATWTPEREDFLLRHVEQINFEVLEDDPAARVQRFAGRAAAAEARSSERAEAASQGLAPMGEPVKLDHHSARRHLRAIERSDQNMRASVEEGKKADYWRGRAAGAERRARQKSDPNVVRRRIERLEADLRKQERRLDLLAGQLDSPRTQTSVTHARRWAEHLELRLAFERARLDALVPAPFATVRTYHKGDVVKSGKWGKCEVVGVGPRNLKLRILEGGARGMILSSPAYEVQSCQD